VTQEDFVDLGLNDADMAKMMEAIGKIA